MTPAILFPEPSYHVQLQQIFDAADGRTQQKLKAALALAVREWRLEAYGLPLLRQLALLAADLRASGTVPLFGRLLRGRLHSVPSSDPAYETVGTILSVLAGFAPGQDIESLFRTLFFDPGFPPHHSAILLNGLCRCAPDRYVDYLPHFFHNAETRPTLFQLNLVLREFVHIVTLATVVKHLHYLERRDAMRLLWLVTAGSPPLVKVQFVSNNRLGDFTFEGSYVFNDTRSGVTFTYTDTNPRIRAQVFFILETLLGALAAPDVLTL